MQTSCTWEFVKISKLTFWEKESFVMANVLQMKIWGGLNDRFCQIESNIIVTQTGEDDQILGTIEVSGSCEGSEPNFGSHSFTNMAKRYLGPRSWKHSCWLMPLWGLQHSPGDTDSARNLRQPRFTWLRTNPGGRLWEVLKCIPSIAALQGFGPYFSSRKMILGWDFWGCCQRLIFSEENGEEYKAWLPLAFGSFVDTQTWADIPLTGGRRRRKNWTFSVHNLLPRDF